MPLPHTVCIMRIGQVQWASEHGSGLVPNYLLLLLIWQSPGLPGWRKDNLITVTRRPLHPSIAAGFYYLTTSPGFLPALCEK